MDNDTYRTGVGDNIRNILGRVNRGGIVGAFGSEFGVPRNFQREALAIDDMPVKLIQLGDQMFKRQDRGFI